MVAAILLSLPFYKYAAQTGESAKADPAAADMENGIRLFQGRDTAAAKLRFSAAIKANPRSADALTWRGIAENQLKQYREAESDFEAALRIDPTELPAHYNLALSLIRMGQTDYAIEQLRTVVKAQPGVAEPEYNLAILLEGKHATPEAIEHLDAAYKKQPSDIAVMQHLLVDLLETGRADEARPILDEIETSNSPEAMQQIGTALLEAGQYQYSLRLLEKARVDSESSHEVNLLLARAYIGAQEDFKAISLLKPSEMNDGSGETAYWLGMAYSDAGAVQEAKHAFQYAFKANPRNGRALYHLGLIESQSPEQLPTGLGHLREATQLEPENSAYGIALGKLLLQQDDAKEAMDLLQRVHAKGKEAAERDLLLGIAQITARGPGQAVPTLLNAVAEDPSLALSYNMLGFCYFVQGDLAKAGASYKQASDLSPQTRIFAHGAAVAFDRSSAPDEAMFYAVRAVTLSGADAEDHYLVGKLFAKAGRREDAIRELNEAFALNPDLDGVYYLLGRTYMQMGDTAKATEWFARLKELKQKHERAYAESKKIAKPVASSTLLQGAPMASSETEAQ